MMPTPTKHSRLFLTSLWSLAVVGCVQPTNPFDAETPTQFQARATLSGTAQAVFALAAGEILVGPAAEDQTLIEPTFCAGRDGDHSGFDIVLREQGSTDGNPLVGRTQESPASGQFVFDNVPPGAYVIQILRPGFDVPPPQPIVLQPGEDVTLDPLCALNRNAPERPALGPLPLVVGADNVAAGAPPGTLASTIEILNCTEGLQYEVEQAPEGDTELAESLRVVVDPAAGDACTVPLALFDNEGGPARTTWRLSVTAVDGLQNRSETVTAFIVRDTLAPTAPVNLATQVGRDRVFLTWTQDPVLGDDRATSWLVSYGLTARPEQAGADCPYGAPESVSGDAFDTAGFAVEGRSPVVVSEIGSTLSGILEGTTLYLQVAAQDAAGNLSCWSAPIAARPDVVSPSVATQEPSTTTGIVASTFSSGLAAFARGSSGVVVRAASGTPQALEGVVALDIDGVGRDLYFASGALGVNTARVNPDGTLTSTEISGVGDVRSLTARPGLIIAGTSTGLTLFAPDAPEAAESFDPTCRNTSVEDVVVDGEVVLALRSDGTSYTLQASHRADLACASDEVLLSQAPQAMQLVGEELWVLSSTRIDAFDFSACRTAPGFDDATCCADTPVNDCLVPKFSAPLQAQARGASMAVWDDLVLVGVNGGSLPSSGVFALEPQPAGPPLVVGVAFSQADGEVRAVEPLDGGFCAYTDASRTCFDAVGGPLAEAPSRFALGAGQSVEFAVASERGVVLFGSGTDGLLRQVSAQTFSGAPVATQTLPDDGPAAPPPDLARRIFAANLLDSRGRVVTLDSFGRAYGYDPARGDGALSRLDTQLSTQISSQWADGVHPDAPGTLALTDALVDTDRGRVVVYASNQLRAASGCAPSALIVIRLVETPAGILQTGAVSVLDLGPSGAPTAITVDGGIAWLASEPYTVLPVNLDTLEVDTGRTFGGAFDCSDEVSGAAAFGVSPLSTFSSHRLLSAGATLVDGTPRPLIEIEGEGELGFDAIGDLEAAGTVGRFIALAAASGTVLLFDATHVAGGDQLIPALSLPTGTRPLSLTASRRGVLFADGPSGAVFHRLR